MNIRLRDGFMVRLLVIPHPDLILKEKAFRAQSSFLGNLSNYQYFRKW